MSRGYQITKGNVNYTHFLPLMEGNDTLELDPDQRFFTKNLTARAIQFIEKHQDEPFLIYLPHPMVHIPLFVSDEFLNTSKRGLYGDAVQEIDWSTGEIVKKLQELKLYDQTMIFFSSDNGPWLPFKTHGGSAGALRGGKGSTWEGGMREPCIIKWPKSNTSYPKIDTRTWSTLDILPTLVDLCQLELPVETIDGTNLLPFLSSADPFPERPIIYYSSQGNIEAIRLGPWKYREQKDTAFLMNVEEDISEQYNLILEQPELAKSLKKKMLDFDEQMNKEMRQHGQLLKNITHEN